MRQADRTLALCLGTVLLLSTGGAAQQPAAAVPELTVGQQAPDFTLQASDGQTYTLSKLKGKTVVLAWFPKAFTAG
jgi:cytochrome oxidase Cu insertion factor (SCO1/SenC/PrrC family)